MQTTAEQEYVEYVTARLPTLRRLAYLLCGDEYRADDLVQQTITTLYARWHRIRSVEHLDRYVRTMLTNAFISERRSVWARVRLFRDAPETAVPPTGPAVEERAVLRSALSRVPRRQQTVLVLRFLCDMSVAEVAETLGCSVGTVKSQTHHGLNTMRRLLGEQAFATSGRE